MNFHYEQQDYLASKKINENLWLSEQKNKNYILLLSAWSASATIWPSTSRSCLSEKKSWSLVLAVMG